MLTQAYMFVSVVLRNLGPEEGTEARSQRVEAAFAERYVAEYRPKIQR